MTPSGLWLAIETATEWGGLALMDGEELLAEQMLGIARHHTATLLPGLDHLLRACGRGLEDVEGVALSVGPGTFTGLRVGLATALGLCFDSARRIVPVPTLAALSLHAPGHARVAPLLDARKGQVYAALYGSEAVALVEARVAEPRAWIESLLGSGPIALLGSGADRYADAIRSILGREATLLPPLAGRPRAATVGWLGQRLAAAGEALPPQDVQLHYLRPPDAQPRSP